MPLWSRPLAQVVTAGNFGRQTRVHADIQLACADELVSLTVISNIAEKDERTASQLWEIVLQHNRRHECSDNRIVRSAAVSV